MTTEVKEIRNATLGIKVTERELAEARFVAGAHATDVSNLLRVMSLGDVLTEAARIREKIAA